MDPNNLPVINKNTIGIIIDPKFENISESHQILNKISKENTIVFTLCSPFQFKFFKEQNYTVYDIGETLFTLEERDLWERQIYGSEWLCYLNDTECYPNYPFNPAAFVSNPMAAISYSLPQLIKTLKFCNQIKLENILIVGYTNFVIAAKNTIKYYKYTSKVDYIETQKINKNRTPLISLKIHVRDTLIILKAIFSRKTLVIYQNAVHTSKFISKYGYDSQILLKVKEPKFFGNSIFNSNGIKKLNYNLERAIKKSKDSITEPQILEAVDIVLQIASKQYNLIFNVINYYKFLSLLKKDIIYIGECSQGVFNPMLHIFRKTKTIYVSHGIFVDTYRVGAHVYNEFTNLYYYTSIDSGIFKRILPYKKEVNLISPYFINPVINNTTADEVKYILFAPTSERHFYMDFQIKEFFEICVKLNEYCKAKGNLKTLVRYHPITPYRKDMYNQLTHLECIEVTPVVAARNLQDDLRKGHIIIATASSTVVTEGFMQQKPIVLLVDRPRHEVISLYDKNLKQVYNADELISRVDELLTDKQEYQKTIALQNDFLEKYVCLN